MVVGVIRGGVSTLEKYGQNYIYIYIRVAKLLIIKKKTKQK